MLKSEIERYRGGIDVENYRAAIAKAAWEAWRRLPPHTRVWLGVEDIIEEGMLWAHTHARNRWMPSRGKFLTWITHCAQRHFITRYLDPLGKCLQRNELGTTGIEDLLWEASRRGNGSVSIDRVLALGVDPDADLLAACFAVDAFVNVYNRATEELKVAIVKWFLRSEHTKFQTTGRRFIETSKEFRDLAHQHQLDINDCRHLIKSPRCMDEVSRKVLWVPYNMDFPTPGLRNG